jgi:hypothetical protein
MANESAEAEAHGQHVKEKAARATGGPQIFSWPLAPDGQPMAIVMGSASDLVPTVPFGNVTIGPVSIMRPVPLGTDEEMIEAIRGVQRMAQYVCGVERRILQWALDPASKIEHPVTGEEFKGEPAGAPAAAEEGNAGSSAKPDKDGSDSPSKSS